jgi:transposase
VERFIGVGVDLAENDFQVHALVAESGAAVKRKLSRAGMDAFSSASSRPSAAMEVCGAAHYWARELTERPDL